MDSNSKGLEALAAIATAAPSPANSTSAKDRGLNGAAGTESEKSGDANGNLSAATKSRTEAETTLSKENSATKALGNQSANNQQSSAPGAVTAEAWQQAITAAASASGLNNFMTPNIGVLPNMQQGVQGDASSMMAMQQLAYYQYMMQSKQGTMGGTGGSVPNHNFGSFDHNQISQLLNGQLAGVLSGSIDTNRMQIIPSSGTPMPQTSSSTSSQSSNSMPPPQSTSVGAKSMASVGSSSTSMTGQATLAPMSSHSVTDSQGSIYEVHMRDKKQQKRAANRRSAQLSRKRKKQFIEELKDENDDLRRKEQILKSIPDLVVVFDSSGKLWFVSESVSRFVKFSSSELEGSSFWERLCPDSVRLLKAAFMDSLAARRPDSDTAALGEGLWELRLVDKDGTTKVITLNGVVHFAGDRPECVCSIRPREGFVNELKGEKKSTDESEATASSKLSIHHRSLIQVAPHQSVLLSGSSSDTSSNHSSLVSKRKVGSKGNEAVRISDSGNSSNSSSESGSGDEMAVSSG